MSDFRVVMIGAGSRANQVTYPSFNDLPGVVMDGICDIDISRRDATADKYGIVHRYGEGGVYEYQKMIADLKPDAVVAVG